MSENNISYEKRTKKSRLSSNRNFRDICSKIFQPKTGQWINETFSIMDNAKAKKIERKYKRADIYDD